MAKRYEGLFILNGVSHDEGLKELVDKITAEVTAAGGTVETTQKMDKRSFARVADKKNTSGFFVNVIFTGDSKTITTLRSRFAMNEGVFRVLFTEAPPPVEAAPAAAAAN